MLMKILVKVVKEGGIWEMKREMWRNEGKRGEWINGVVRDFDGRLIDCRICSFGREGFVICKIDDEGRLVEIFGSKFKKRRVSSKEIGVYVMDDELNWVMLRVNKEEERNEESYENWFVNVRLNYLSGFMNSSLRSSKEYEFMELLLEKEMGLLDEKLFERFVMNVKGIEERRLKMSEIKRLVVEGKIDKKVLKKIEEKMERRRKRSKELMNWVRNEFDELISVEKKKFVEFEGEDKGEKIVEEFEKYCESIC